MQVSSSHSYSIDTFVSGANPVTYLGSLPSSVYAAIGPNSNVMLRDLWGRPSPYLDMYVLFVYR
jgi:hypothetical protein